METTQRIPNIPTPVSHGWIGAATTGAGAAWVVSLTVIVSIHRTEGMILSAGLVLCLLVSLFALALWVKHSLQKTNATDHAHIQQIMAGQHALTMAKLNELERLLEETGGHSIAQLQALGVKVGKVAELPGYWDGFADGVTKSLNGDADVVDINRARTPRSN